MEKELNKSVFTENGALSNASTLNSVLDFFSKSGALRGDNNTALELFKGAFREDELLAKKALFYSRDVRGGQGERSNFRNILHFLAESHPESLRPNVQYIPKFGRWDDIYSLFDTKCERDALSILKTQFEQDLQDLEANKNVSLLGKWLKSENASSADSKQIAKRIRKYFGLKSKEYRQALTKLRAKIDIVERKMTLNQWEDINYSHIPSNAMKQYTKAFKKHDDERYTQYLGDVAAGKSKINASTLYPYDIACKYINGLASEEENATLEALWNNLPNYFTDGEYNTLCVVDVSGSMYSGRTTPRPIDVAISLGLYMAERNKGPLKDYFLTFSERPEIVKIKGATLKDRIEGMKRANWGCNTNLLLVFQVFLDIVQNYNLSVEEIPKKLFIISDMQFDAAISNSNKTTFENIEAMFKKANVQRPDLIFWNVNAHSDTPVTKDDHGTFLVSGASPSILAHALNSEAVTPLELMLDVLNSERYSCIQ